MTKTMMHIGSYGDIYFDCLNHSGDYTVCAIVSTLCNVLVSACIRSKIEPREYKAGHVTIDIDKAEFPLIEVFRSVWDVMLQVAEQYPDCVEIY